MRCHTVGQMHAGLSSIFRPHKSFCTPVNAISAPLPSALYPVERWAGQRHPTATAYEPLSTGFSRGFPGRWTRFSLREEAFKRRWYLCTKTRLCCPSPDPASYKASNEGQLGYITRPPKSLNDLYQENPLEKSSDGLSASLRHPRQRTKPNQNKTPTWHTSRARPIRRHPRPRQRPSPMRPRPPSTPPPSSSTPAQ